MPFCCKCGTTVGPADVYCAVCGARQHGAAIAPPPPARAGAGNSITPRTASMLCYIPFLGWIASIVVLASERFRHDRSVRFHAFQGLYLFVVWLIVDHVVAPILGFGAMRPMHLAGLAKAGMLVVWVFMLIKTGQEQFFSLPFIGELADRSVSEQK
jgi:uncharacterized membrane protein